MYQRKGNYTCEYSLTFRSIFPPSVFYSVSMTASLSSDPSTSGRLFYVILGCAVTWLTALFIALLYLPFILLYCNVYYFTTYNCIFNAVQTSCTCTVLKFWRSSKTRNSPLLYLPSLPYMLSQRWDENLVERRSCDICKLVGHHLSATNT